MLFRACSSLSRRDVEVSSLTMSIVSKAGKEQDGSTRSSPRRNRSEGDRFHRVLAENLPGDLSWEYSTDEEYTVFRVSEGRVIDVVEEEDEREASSSPICIELGNIQGLSMERHSGFNCCLSVRIMKINTRAPESGAVGSSWI